ncbi:ATP-binding protein [Streptomyces sp. NPDC005811]|uniref:ATP-binding protein n=1 Tax=Streptomyces sp. NPDC005811 TaxID=3154565 RepID=UPI0033E042C9
MSAGWATADATEPDDRLDYMQEAHETTRKLLQEGREATGTGGLVDKRSLRRVLREEGLSFYPLTAITALGVAQLAPGAVDNLLTPDIGASLGLGPGVFAALDVVTMTMSTLLPVWVARFVQNKARRAFVMLTSAIAFALVVPLTGLVMTAPAYMLIYLADNLTTSASSTVDQSLSMDIYPPQVRIRVLAAIASATSIASLLAQGSLVLLVGPLGLNWRGAYLVAGAFSVVCTMLALGLRDPGYGTYDIKPLRDVVRRHGDESERPEKSGRQEEQEHSPTDSDRTEPAVPVDIRRDRRSRLRRRVASRTSVDLEGPDRPPGTKLTLFEAIRRVWMVKTFRLTLIGGLIVAMPAPLQVYLQFYYTGVYNLSAAQRGLLSMASEVVGLASFYALAPLSDRIFQRNPALLFYINAILAVVLLVVSVIQFYYLAITFMVAWTMAGSLFAGLNGPALNAAQQTVVPAPLRPHVGAVQSTFFLAGTAVSTALFGVVASQVSLQTAMIVISLFTLIGIVYQFYTGLVIRTDLDKVVEDVVEEEVIEHMRRRGNKVPLLACRNLDFSYGQTQVLFDVDFHVEQGEMVSLLGVNGAGKSTLLRAISGVDLPQRGTIRLDGHDITYLEAHRRSQLGITQVPGGRAVFTDLTVVENLRCFAYQHRGRRKVVEGLLDDAFEAFPKLASRRNSPAGRLSGGEQQMLGLASTYITRPRLLLIDELSLGLAPIVVEELLDMVRMINRSGTSVVVVEQSVNVALSLTQRACFMEQGQVLFDGPSRELIDDTELLRAVFLRQMAEEST